MQISSPGRRGRSASFGLSAGSLLAGFTLTELILVIAVAGILLAMTTASLSRGKSVARDLQCKSNLRQLGLAVRIYIDDNDRYPPFASRTGVERRFWPETLAPMLIQVAAGSQSVSLRCPSYRAQRTSQSGLASTYGYSDRGYAFQGLGEKLIFAAGGWSTTEVPDSEVAQPTDCILIGDGILRLNNGLLLPGGIALNRWLLFTPVEPSAPPPLTEQQMASDRSIRALHAGRAHMVFCDGHVEANQLKFLFDDLTDNALRQWNRDHEPHREWLVPY